MTASFWDNIVKSAVNAGLDASKFSDQHREIAQLISSFVSSQSEHLEQVKRTTAPHGVVKRIAQNLPLLRNNRVSDASKMQPVSPIIISGVPGTGKTTFLHLLDTVLRSQFSLPDNIVNTMHNTRGDSFAVQKRVFDGQPRSLLSVHAWSALLHFYTWDRDRHELNPAAQRAFIHDVLLPMRVLFADEVEMTGYSPTIPTLANEGILVVGTSNQYEFGQLANYDLSPRLFNFGGEDMRLGNPGDAVVVPDEPVWHWFDQRDGVETAVSTSLSTQIFSTLTYHYWQHHQLNLVQISFEEAMRAPFLETEWLAFLRTISEGNDLPCILLIDDFSLSHLRTNFDAILRFVTLFDAIEQVGTAVFIRNRTEPIDLSREAFRYLKTAVYNTFGVDIAIKQRTLSGVDRCISRLGQAGQSARQLLTF